MKTKYLIVGAGLAGSVLGCLLRKADEAKVEQFIRNTAILMEGIPVTPLA